MQPRTRLSLVAIATIGSIAACGGDDTAAPTTTIAVVSASEAPPAPTSSADSTPVVAPGGSTEGARLLVYANALMLSDISRDEAVAFFSNNVAESDVESCMNSAGFEYIPEAGPEEMVAEDLRYSMSAEEYAATYGLGIAGWDLGVIPTLAPQRDPDVQGSMTESEREAYHGALGQCRGVFDSERRAWSDAINIAVDQFRPVVDADEQVVAALADWQSCMTAAGYDFDTPRQMRESFYARMTSESLQSIFDDEVRVAVTNVTCEAAYNATLRQVISDRFAEFKAFFEAAHASGAAPEAQG